MGLAIAADRLSKRYHLGRDVSRYGRLTEAISDRLTFRLRRDETDREHEETLWALRDVSLEVAEGEVLGIIGRNGAGKSTLLKILARVTEPTSGRAEIHGRVGSLLEVGTGFHQELTGRENIFLNGAILGMRRAEIKRKFDDIVAFAEVERFLDTPVKRYSSGMYVRLAFAVAAHLEPEVLIVDEVLAVGDVAFQKKCLGKIGEVARDGRTVLFISHNMGAIERLCTRCVLLEGGRLTADGPTIEVIKKYLRVGWRPTAEWKRPASRPWGDHIVFQEVRTVRENGDPAGSFLGSEPVRIELEYVIRRPMNECQIGVRLTNSEGVAVLWTSDCDERNVPAVPRGPGTYSASVEIPGRFLTPGTYSMFVAAHSPGIQLFEQLEDVITFEVDPPGALTQLDDRIGVVTPLLAWQLGTTASVAASP